MFQVRLLYDKRAFSIQEIAHELLGDRFSTGVLLIIISYKKVQEDMKLWKRDCLHQSL